MINARTVGAEVFRTTDVLRPSTVSPSSRRRRQPNRPPPNPRSFTSMSYRRGQRQSPNPTPSRHHHRNSPASRSSPSSRASRSSRSSPSSPSSRASRPSTSLGGRSRSAQGAHSYCYKKDKRLQLYQLPYDRSTPTGNQFPSSPYLRLTQSKHFRTPPSSTLPLPLPLSLSLPTAASETAAAAAAAATATATATATTITKTKTKASAVNEHNLSAMWQQASKEGQIRFINFILDEICGTEDTREIQPEVLLDEDATYAQCNVKLLECLQGSSGYNVFRRRMLMWKLMEMCSRPGEGGVWESVILNNRSLRIRVEALEAEVASLDATIVKNHAAFNSKRNEDILETDRVVGRVKTLLEKYQLQWNSECGRSKKLENEIAVNCIHISQQHEKIQHLSMRADAAEALCLKKDRQMENLRIKIHELTQLEKNSSNVAPSLTMIIKAMKSNEKQSQKK